MKEWGKENSLVSISESASESQSLVPFKTKIINGNGFAI